MTPLTEPKAQVIGVPDDIAGELPVAIIQPLDLGPLPVDQLQALVQASLGAQNVPVTYLTLQDLGIDAFPTTTSGKVRKDKLRTTVIRYLSAQAVANDVEKQTTMTTLDSNEQLLVQTFAKITGQPAETVSVDTPIASLTDSINILRFQAQLKKLTSKNITTEDVLRAASVRALAQQLNRVPNSDQSSHFNTIREGPPTTAEMVHAQGQDSQALRTRLATEPLLTKLGMSWLDVEDVFPMPDLSSRYFEAVRAKAYTIRMAFVARSASKSKLRRALEATLEQWPMFRVFAVKLDKQPLFVTVRAGRKWSEATITEVTDLNNPEDLCSVSSPIVEKNNVQPSNGGPLAQFVIANIRSTGTAGLMILAHHSPHDAISLGAFGEDLEQMLAGGSEIEPRTPFKIFADMYYQLSSSLLSQIAVAFHVNRLSGIGSLGEACWPRQRCVGWHIGDDDGYKVPIGVDAALSTERKPIDNDAGDAGRVGIQKTAHLNDLGELRSKHNVSAPVLFKAACALLNSHLTLSREVLFSNSQSGRQWPFLDPSIAKYLPNPVTIAGNTITAALNRIQVHPHETVGSFLARLEEEQRLLTTHAHAPLPSIISQLSPSDAAAYITGGRRQLLNWNPSLADTVTEKSNEMRLVQLTGDTELMLLWHCGMLGGHVGSVHMQWDGCQVGKMEVQGWADGFVKALAWVARLDNWDRKIEELEW